MQLTTLGDVLKWAETSFLAADLHYGHGTDNAWDEAVALALYVLELPPDVDASVTSRVLTPQEKDTLVLLINRRITDRVPVPYLTHEAWLGGLKFYVDSHVIIPRSPIAELILNDFQPWLGERPLHRILDLCTGSGCLAILCAKQFEDAKIDAVDISEDALSIAKKNVLMHQVENRVSLRKGDLWNACKMQKTQEKNPKYDIIISNPPYVDKLEMSLLPKEYQHEPSLALEAGSDGLQIVRQILERASDYLSSEGLLFVEVGHSKEALISEYPNLPFTWLEFERGGEGVFMIEKSSLLSMEKRKC